jgi:outer membrane protein OmpA-like peptidoglycan-associated protein
MKLTTVLLCAMGIGFAQVPNPTQKQPALGPNETGQAMPIFRVTVVSRTTKAVNYHHRTGTTHIDFRGTELMPTARGQASVSSQMGSTKIETTLQHMGPPAQFGTEYMTYVLWAVTPEGRPMNLGEVVLEGGDHAKLLSTTDLQTFGLIVTAEPYFAVTQPSDVVVAENFLRNDTSGTIEQVDAKYELLQRGQYVFNRAQYVPVKINPKGPLQLAEAQNAVEIARLAGAEKYAGDTFQKALIDLKNAEGFLNGSKNRKESETNAREAAQMAEDARIITFRKIREEELAKERAAAAQREADERAKAEESARQAQESARRAQESAEQARVEQERRAQAESERLAAEKAKAEAMQAQQSAQQAAEQARLAAEQAQKDKAAADEARAAALAQQQALAAEAERAKQAAQVSESQRQQAEAMRQQAEAEKLALRERLRNQLNTILETRETQRGLIVNISDVLFDFNKYTLKPGAREKLAKVAGILLAYPGLKIQLEGHTDSIGTDEYNQKLSEQRAEAVRSYLTSQSVPGDTMTAIGLGKSGPVATNDTASGRQQNRRVDMVVSGQPIGIDMTPSGAATSQVPRQQ